jgi:hypothetical protein
MIDWSSYAGNLDCAGLRLCDAIRFVPGEPEPPLLCHLIGKLNRPALLTPSASESHVGVHQGAHRERGWTMSVKSPLGGAGQLTTREEVLILGPRWMYSNA